QGVDAVEFFQGLLDHGLRLPGLAEVARERDDPATGLLGQLARTEQRAFPRDIGNEHVGTFLRETPCDGHPHALRGARDDHRAALEAPAMDLDFTLTRGRLRLRHSTPTFPNSGAGTEPQDRKSV